MKKLESGRSMVEMLGVLAIIGVLSIGGIAGYVLSMNRYRANAMLDVANKYAAIVFSSYQSYIANGGAASDWKAPSLATAKLEGTLQPGTTIAISKGSAEGSTDSSAIDGTDVNLVISFPGADICETALGIAGYDVTPTPSSGGTATAPEGSNTRTCSSEAETSASQGIKLSNGIVTFKQS